MMPTLSKIPKAPAGNSSSTPFNYADVRSSLEHISSFASGPQMQNAKDLFDELENLQKQKFAIQETLEDERAQRKIGINQINENLQEEKAKNIDAETKLKLAFAEVEAKTKLISQNSQDRKCLEARMQALQSENAKVKEKSIHNLQEAASLRKQLKEQNDMMEKFKANESRLNADLSSEKQNNTDLQKLYKDTLGELHHAQSQLKKIKNLVGVHNQKTDEAPMVDAYVGLWENATDEIFKVLKQDIPTNFLKNKEEWKKIRAASYSLLSYHIPLPASNTDAAKRMRLAVVLAILSRDIDKYIFQPAYLISEDFRLRKTLSKLAETDPEKEWLYRSMTLSIDCDSQQAALRSNIQHVVQQASNFVYGLLSDVQFGEFREAITRIVNKAAEVWKSFQHSRTKYEADFEPLYYGDENLCLFKFPETDNSQFKPDFFNVDDNAVIIFPRISSISDKRRHVLAFVDLLPLSHPICVMANKETIPTPSSPTGDRIQYAKTRRNSIAAQVGLNGKLPLDKKANGVH